MKGPRRATLSAPLADRIRGLHPQIKRKLRAGLDDVLDGREHGKPLQDELAGLFSLRIGRFRLIYQPRESGDVEVMAFGPRSAIYEETLRCVRRASRTQS